VKREIICPVCDRDLVKVVPPTYPGLDKHFEGVRRRRGRARLPLRCDQCNNHIDLLGLCFAWSIYRGGPGRAGLPPTAGEYFEWEATRLELGPAMPGLPGWACAQCKSELEPEDACQVVVRERPAGAEQDRERALEGAFHRWCSEAATRDHYSRLRHEHGLSGCPACDYGRLQPCPLLALGGAQ
jgi:hypothetical protein